MATTNTALMGIGTSVLGLAGNPNVTDELGRTSMAFGDLLKGVGDAVGQTQIKLNQTGAATTSTLANTLVDVIAVRETVLDDLGNITDEKTHVRTLPLVNFIDPVFYEWRNVRVQGQFYTQEFATSAEKTSTYSSTSKGVGQSGFLFIFGAGGFKKGSASGTTTTDVDTTSDVSYGNIRMNALLMPKTDIGVPKPRLVMRGPRINIIRGELNEIVEGGHLTARTLSVLIEFYRPDGTAIPGKELSIDSQGAAWSYEGGVSATDANGRVRIVLRREFLDPAAPADPVDVVLTARRGMVTNSTTLAL